MSDITYYFIETSQDNARIPAAGQGCQGKTFMLFRNNYYSGDQLWNQEKYSAGKTAARQVRTQAAGEGTRLILAGTQPQNENGNY